MDELTCFNLLEAATSGNNGIFQKLINQNEELHKEINQLKKEIAKIKRELKDLS